MRKNKIFCFNIRSKVLSACFFSLILMPVYAEKEKLNKPSKLPFKGIDMFIEESSWGDYKKELADYTDTEDSSAFFSVYHGDLFNIDYPEFFKARPLKPVERKFFNVKSSIPIKQFDDGLHGNEALKVKPKNPSKYFESEYFEYVNTDKAYFMSPDGSVEFFVYAKDSGDGPPNYTKVADDEVKVSSRSDKSSYKKEHLNYVQKSWVTIKAKNNSYYRSYIHQRACHHDSGSKVMWVDCETQVLGVKYSTAEAYDAYRGFFIAFNRSLERSAEF